MTMMHSDDSIAVAAVLERPALRGTLHVAAAVAAVIGAVALLLIAETPSGYVGAAIFASSLILLYTTSASYHQVPWSDGWRRFVKRIDHSVIFLLIAGTYTPFCLHVSLAWGIPLLAVVWTLAGAGVLMKLAWPDGPRWLSVALYVGLGWVGVAGATEVLSQYAGGPIALIILGGALYTIGGIVYALQRPNPWPRVFGYHEVFHALVVAGSAVHYAAIAVYVL
jgi:hemolysin III